MSIGGYMTLGDYIQMKDSYLPMEILKATQENVLSRVKPAYSKENLHKLSNFLNHAFYPHKYRSDAQGVEYGEKIKKLIEDLYEAKYNAALNNFSAGSSNVTYGVEDLPAIIGEKHESYSHSEKIYRKTIETRFAAVEKYINEISTTNNQDALQEYHANEQKVNELYRVLKELKTLKTGSSDFINLKTADQDIISKVKLMDNLYGDLVTVGGIFTPEDYGQVLEWILQALSQEQGERLIDYEVEELTDDFINAVTKTAGSSKVESRNTQHYRPGASSGDINIAGRIEKVTEKRMNNKTKKEYDQQVYKITDGKNSFSYDLSSRFTPDNARQGKIDVLFNLSDDTNKKSTFRISAKNWQNLKRDFGETNVIYALLRTLESDTDAMLYAFTLGDRYAESAKKQESHLLAQYALFVDILMGYSQENNYADTLVINIRSEEKVLVLSIVDIIKNLKENLNKLSLPDYQSSLIEQSLSTLLDIASENNDASYIDLAFRFLQTMIVKLQFSVVSDFTKIE